MKSARKIGQGTHRRNAYMHLCLMLIAASISFNAAAQKTKLNDYNVIWATPGLNSQGSIPLGNGDIGINVWVERNGDLLFYLSKTDAWSENGQLLKLGKIRITLTPKPLVDKSFLQTLKLQQGEILVNYGKTAIRLWVDANHPVVQVEIAGKTAVDARVSIEPWRIKHRPITGKESRVVWGIGESAYDPSCAGPIYQEPDTLVAGNPDKVIWFHHNSYSIWKENLELESLGDLAKTEQDPLLNRNFGALIQARGMVSKSDTVLVTTKPSKQILISICSLTSIGSSDSWKNSLLKTAAQISSIPVKSRKADHDKWWQQFWDRNYIFISSKDQTSRKEAEIVTQGYILQRFVNACGGRGNSPIKFNGTIFTVDTYDREGEFNGFDADFRQWGGCYWWQNTRLPYWTMLISGDYDMMEPLFNMYFSSLPLRKLATKKYYGHEGAFYPETMNFWGTHANGDYGCDRNGKPAGYTNNPYIRYYWQGGLEMSLMMLDYYSFTLNQNFAGKTLVPFVSEILTFYNQHWKRGDDGKILFSPAMSLETFHRAVNPLPEIVGIRKVAEKMLALPERLTSEAQRKQWAQLIRDLPEVPLRLVNNETVIAPAKEFYEKANVENPELYAIFPYRTYGIGKPDLELAKRTFAARVQKENGGWQQNSIQAACLGLTNEVRRMVVESFSTWDRNFRFPAFWGPNYDWTPDQDHGNVAMIALQRMLIQYENDKVQMVPAWPKDWDVHFKLNGPGNTIIQGTYSNGKIQKVNTNRNPVHEK